MTELVRVATAANQAEAELIQGLLREEGVPSLVRRAGGFDVPDFLAAGPRDILVLRDCALTAREAIGTPVPQPHTEEDPGRPDWVRPLAVALLVLLLAALAAGWAALGGP